MIAVIFQASLKGISITHTFGGVLWHSLLTFILCLWQLLIIVSSLLLDVQVDICSTREEVVFFFSPQSPVFLMILGSFVTCVVESGLITEMLPLYEGRAGPAFHLRGLLGNILQGG